MKMCTVEGIKNQAQNQLVLSTFLYSSLCIDCILSHPDDGHRSGRNVLEKNNNM